MDRKSFFRKIASGLGHRLAKKINDVEESIEKNIMLTREQKVFLGDYSRWLAEFEMFVKKWQDSPFDIVNNKKLMALSDQAERRKPELELHMKDAAFAEHFNGITEDISGAIG